MLVCKCSSTWFRQSQELDCVFIDRIIQTRTLTLQRPSVSQKNEIFLCTWFIAFVLSMLHDSQPIIPPWLQLWNWFTYVSSLLFPISTPSRWFNLLLYWSVVPQGFAQPFFYPVLIVQMLYSLLLTLFNHLLTQPPYKGASREELFQGFAEVLYNWGIVH